MHFCHTLSLTHLDTHPPTHKLTHNDTLLVTNKTVYFRFLVNVKTLRTSAGMSNMTKRETN